VEGPVIHRPVILTRLFNHHAIRLARSASGKTRDLVEDNALDQSSTPSSVPDQRRVVRPLVLYDQRVFSSC
jgi:hypothetical protein